ncbi:hypothetical protein FAES_5215 [Fibrella aestuarina BUZ 2]|uniref:Type VI secretion protein n=1 Tax=Fibrella aestuarina BUZ 2 TaxID=1166018 RepID=I0KGG1_9BACT|nr:PAAR domain-containing protein [Fibrella aestuarina]CCH03214.1 hypothetical protein FAES_5215 [Fibrella aestuarina BUZ 2]
MGKPAARSTDMHTCPMVTPGTPPVPHVGGPILKGSPNVLIGGLPAATVGDTCVCVGPTDSIIVGSMSVYINGKPAARMGDNTLHGGIIVGGCPTVLIGDVGVIVPGVSLPDLNWLDKLSDAGKRAARQTMALKQAAANGAIFCEVC